MNGLLTATSTPSAGDDEEADTPQHCAAGEHCINAVTLPSGEQGGAAVWRVDPRGVEYVKEAIAEAQEGLGSKEVMDLWRQHYADAGYDMPDAVEVES